MEVYAEMQKLDPPVRFLIEGLIHPTTNTTSSATDATPQENEEISKTSTLHVNPNLLRKTWLCVEPEKAMKKILHRLRERIRDEDEPTAAVSPTHSQYNEVDDVFSNDCAIIEDDSREPFKIYPLHTSDVNSEVALLQVQDTSPEDWQLLHHHLRDLSKEESVKRIETEQERRSSDYCGSLDASEYVEGNGLDLVVEPTPGLELESSHHCCNYTLRQWVMSSKPEINPNATDSMQSSTDAAKYIRSALQIALKLTECLLEAEKDEQSDLVNPIPLASIAPENVLIRTKVESAIEQSSEHIMEIIEFAWVMSFLGDDSATGGVMARLFALGKVFYELFSTNELVIDADTTTMLTMMSMHSIDLRNVRNIADKHPQKKSHWRSDQADNTTITNAVSNLVANGIPRPLCSLVKNLLECRHGSFCEDDAYASFADLQQDLQLMMDNPVCFLSNLHINNSPKLEVYDTCYGRDDELMKLSELYERHFTDKNINGVIISGGPGVGKSKLAMSVQKLTNQHGGYFVTTKFEQNQNDIKPLSTISKLFDSLCEMLFNDSSSSELELIEEELKDAIGSQSILQVILPSLNKLMPSSSSLELLATNFVNSALSMAYQLGEFMRVVSAHSKPITMFIDDLQFADIASLRLVGNLLSNERRAIFFIFAHRKDDDILNESFHAWLGSIALFSLEEIHLESMSSDAVNTLISETLHLSPRITRPLSSVLHHKTLGNPLFLRQVLTSLTDQRYIYIDMAQHRWVWDLDKIMEMEISDGVVMFLIKQIQRLPRDQQFGLQVAACIGTCIIESVVDYLSRDLGHNLKEVLRMVCQEGFMLDVAGTFRFAHDRIQEAVYEMMPEQQRRENHMQFGLSLCTHVLTSSFDNLELFFVAVNQINQGGPAAVHDSSQNSIIAELNLKAGRRAIQFSDCATAFILFQHGISFLGYDKWTSNYQICLDLYDEVTGVACILGQLDVIRLNSEEVIRHARNFDDKLHCE